ncbi:uncharacterized protein [Halyomorpha halys]|uniref:uncharacterized protein n=1 Tax=Halyomorpha halys TaxID=286706 RepID=UPI0006D50559|nr:uncharacterized protein LOC106691835 [Halyomorpha halys]
MEGVLGERAEVQTWTEDSLFELRDLEALTTKELVAEALKPLLGEDSVPTTVVKSIRKAYRGTQTAVTSLPVLKARKVMGQGKVRLGLVVTHIRERLRVAKCFRCWEYGNIARNCIGKDRTSLCRNCGKARHKANDCDQKPDVCAGNGDADHPSRSSKCPASRSALRTMMQIRLHRT